MFGTLRLALAVMVAASHSGIAQEPLWIGVVAVVLFFIISGFAMTALIEKRFLALGSERQFFAERFVRLAPQYYFWLALSLTAAFGTAWMPLKVTGMLPYELAAYLTVIPLGLQFYIHLMESHILPQATSLGIEVIIYVLSPWVVKSRSLSWTAFLICLGIFIATAGNFISSNIYTYYCFPGPMAFFLLGTFLLKKMTGRLSRPPPGSWS